MQSLHVQPSFPGSTQLPGVCLTRSLPLRPKLLDKEAGIFLRKTGLYYTLMSVQYPGGHGLPRAVSTVVRVSWEQGMQVSQGSGHIPRAVAIKTRASDMFKSSPPRDTSTLGHNTGRVQRWPLLGEKKKIDVSRWL